MDQERANLSDRSRSRSNTPLSAAIRNTLKKRAIGSEERFQEYKLLIHATERLVNDEMIKIAHARFVMGKQMLHCY